jgi:hypothetical protein
MPLPPPLLCTTIYQILLDSRKIYRHSRRRLRSKKIFVLVAAPPRCVSKVFDYILEAVVGLNAER